MVVKGRMKGGCREMREMDGGRGIERTNGEVRNTHDGVRRVQAGKVKGE